LRGLSGRRSNETLEGKKGIDKKENGCETRSVIPEGALIKGRIWLKKKNHKTQLDSERGGGKEGREPGSSWLQWGCSGVGGGYSGGVANSAKMWFSKGGKEERGCETKRLVPEWGVPWHSCE